MDIFTSKTMEPMFSDASMFFDHVQDDETLSPVNDDLDDFSMLQHFPEMTGTNSMDFTDAAKEARQQAGGFMHAHILGCDHRLSSLNLDLSRRLQRYLAIAWPDDDLMLDISIDSTDGGKSGQHGSLCAKLLGDALSDTSEFLGIIQSYAPERRKGINDTIPSTSPRLGIIVILNLLSVYIQLVVIYDKLFHRLSNQLFDRSLGSVAGLETLPGLQLAGFSAQRGNLQTKILMHAILHQFEMIERILGLPAEFRVTEKQNNYLGLFEDGRARGLLEAMSNGKWFHAAIDEHCGLKALSSLREMLKRVQVSYNM
ncbi:hypothetical protein MMC15_008491 [Xylographa vitiligo]|nr:hypothetical protein [Xylographa vitiligo]